MKILVDGVFFQLSQSGIARLWRSLLEEFVQLPGIEIIMLDRGGVPEIPGISHVQFPSYTLDKYNANDSFLIEEACLHWKVDLFLSTYYTTPIRTPSIAIVYDMIPEVLGFDLSVRDWMEKELALSHARRHLCISQQTRIDLLSLYPELKPSLVDVAYCGVDTRVFSPEPKMSKIEVQSLTGFHRPFFVLVGSRNQHNNYKNSRIFFESLDLIDVIDFDILCVGGETEIEEHVLSTLLGRCSIRRVELDDTELAGVYQHALALVYPSLYEGFGMPVAEAMSCGCPVITTHHGALRESAGNAAIVVSGHSVEEMADALQSIRNTEIRSRLIADGYLHAKQFRWSNFANVLAKKCHIVIAESRSDVFQEFNTAWSNLRNIQSQVDVL